MTLEKVKTNRREEATRAAEILGGKTIFFDVGDYPMRIPDTVLYELAALYRRYRPRRLAPDTVLSPRTTSIFLPDASAVAGHCHSLHFNQYLTVSRSHAAVPTAQW